MKIKTQTYTTIKKLTGYVCQNRGFVALSILFAVLSNSFAIATPFVIGLGIDKIVAKGEVDFVILGQNLFILAVLYIVSALFNYLLTISAAVLTNRTVTHMRQAAFLKLMHVPLKYFDTNAHGDVISKLTTDIEAISDGVFQSIKELLSGMISIIGAILFMMRLNFWISLIVIGITPLCFLISGKIAKKSHQYFTKQTLLNGALSSVSEEFLLNQKIVLALGMHEEAEKRYDLYNKQLYVVGQKAQFYSSLHNPSTRLLNYIIYALLGIFGGVFAVTSHLSVGSISSFITYSTSFSQPINNITAVFSQLQAAISSTERVLTLIEYEPESDDSDNPPLQLLSETQVRLPPTPKLSFREKWFKTKPSKALDTSNPIPNNRVDTSNPIPNNRVDTSNPIPNNRVDSTNPIPNNRVDTQNPIPNNRVDSSNPIPCNRVDSTNPIPCNRDIDWQQRIPDNSVEFKQVNFSYNTDQPLIENFSIYVPNQTRVAIVGRTGSGKTTLVNLLMRFYDVNSGEIRVSNQDINEVTRASVRNCFGMVLQDTWLKQGSVKENIAFGKENATDAEIYEAAERSGADCFIQKLENGYDTLISEGAGNLSQGQKQLLTIARAMVASRPFLILDEATSSVDTRTELHIQRAFLDMMQGHTTFVIAHRLSTIKDADIILVLDKGNIVEKGNHKQLLKENGLYAKLYNAQYQNSL